MSLVHERVYVGALDCCSHSETKRAVVHACKSPCHQTAVGYSGSLPNTHPNYLVLERGNHLYLNLIDPPVPLFKSESFAAFRAFATVRWNGGMEILIHCNQGESRAPTLCLLFLAKVSQVIPGDSYQTARAAFTRLYPGYSPGAGIATFMNQNWASL